MTDALMLRLLRSGVLAPPHPLDPPHSCCWIVGGEDCGPCGLWCGHDGEHVPYTPGAYLPPSIISLSSFRVGPNFTCPLCAASANHVVAEGPFRVARDGDGSASWYELGDGPGDVEILYQFGPCGCEGREILPAP